MPLKSVKLFSKTFAIHADLKQDKEKPQAVRTANIVAARG